MIVSGKKTTYMPNSSIKAITSSFDLALVLRL